MGVIFNDVCLRPNESVVIVGCGGVGLNSIQAAALLKGYPIIAVDINEDSLNIAKEFGATHTVNVSKTDIKEKVMEITKNQGSEHVVLTLGNPKAIEKAVDVSSVPGTVYFVGVPPTKEKITIDPFKVHMLRTLRGSCGGSTFPDKDIPSYINLYKMESIRLKELISEYVSLDEINKGVEMVKSGKKGRIVIKMDTQ